MLLLLKRVSQPPNHTPEVTLTGQVHLGAGCAGRAAGRGHEGRGSLCAHSREAVSGGPNLTLAQLHAGRVCLQPVACSPASQQC